MENVYDIEYKFFKNPLKWLFCFEKLMLMDWFDCFWGQYNWLGKLIFLPFTIGGSIMAVIILPFIYCLTKIFTLGK